MSIQTVEINTPDSFTIVEIRQGPAGEGGGGSNSITSATTSDGTADLLLANVETATAEVTGTLIAPHIHGNLAGSVYAHVRAGEALAKGDPVYVSGSHGSGSTLIAEVSKADASNAAKMPAVGIMDAAVANNASGHMVIIGTITELNTAAYSINAELYVASGGGMTATPPTARAQPVARVERANTNNGAILVKVNGLSASDATPSTLVRRTSGGGASFAGINTNSGSYSQVGGANFNVATTTAANLTATGSGTVTVSGEGGTTISGGTLTFSPSGFAYAAGAASAHRTALGSGATGDELFLAASASAARTTLELDAFSTNGSITGTGVLTFTSAAASNISLTPGTTGFVEIAKASASGVRESILRATVSDASGDGFFVANGTSANGRFAPSFGGAHSSSNSLWSLQFAGFVTSGNDASDSSNFGIVDIAAFRTSTINDPFNGTLTDVANRKLLTVRSLTGTKVEVAASGAMKLNATTASTSTTTGALVVSGGAGIAGAVNSLYQRVGSGTPEGAVTAPVGSVYHRTDGGAGTSFYVKESGTGNTGWVAK